jgi:predicted phosphohydrolase
MKIQISSDLHLDQLKGFNSYTLFDYKKLIYPEGDILILAGDVCRIEDLKKYEKFFKYLNNNFHYIIYIPGNHEFYNKKSMNIEEMTEIMKIFLENNDYKNFIYLDNRSVLVEDILFTGSCLWCHPHIDPPSWFNIDISKEEICKMNKESINYLEKISSVNHKNHIIITHYPPLQLDLKFDYSKKDQYRDYYINKNILLNSPPKYWIFGHTHNNFKKEINSTTYLSNQRKDKTYKNNLFISL